MLSLHTRIKTHRAKAKNWRVRGGEVQAIFLESTVKRKVLKKEGFAESNTDVVFVL